MVCYLACYIRQSTYLDPFPLGVQKMWERQAVHGTRDRNITLIYLAQVSLGQSISPFAFGVKKNTICRVLSRKVPQTGTLLIDRPRPQAYGCVTYTSSTCPDAQAVHTSFQCRVKHTSTFESLFSRYEILKLKNTEFTSSTTFSFILQILADFVREPTTYVVVGVENVGCDTNNSDDGDEGFAGDVDGIAPNAQPARKKTVLWGSDWCYLGGRTLGSEPRHPMKRKRTEQPLKPEPQVWDGL